jgi:hypothetical protein
MSSRTQKVARKMRKTGIVAALAVALMATPMLSGVASAGDSAGNTITPTVQQGTTDRLGGGDWVVVHAGNTNFGVVYGTAQNPNKLYIFADYKRYIAGADFYDAQGNFIKTRGVPVETVFAQSLDRLIEFKDVDDNNRFDMRMWDGTQMGSDVPVKSLNLVQAWTLSDLTNETIDGVLFVNFTVGISNQHYTYVWSELMRRPVPAPPSAGEVENVAFTFHIRVALEDASASIPWFNVTIGGGDERRVIQREFAGWREFTGERVNMSVKYDHYIAGWDFASNESKLLLETGMMFGNVVPRELQERYRLRDVNRICDGECEREGRELGNETRDMSREPMEVAPQNRQGTITFADDWERIGRFTWESDVTVDGEQEDMYFQVHGGGPWSFDYNRVTFVGMRVLGAFVYPAGMSIFHDPAFDATAYEFGISTVTNLAPQTVLLLQLAAVIVAIIAAVALKVTRKARK